MLLLAAALRFSSLPGLIVAAAVAGVGQGISFSRGLADIVELTPADRRAAVSSTYFVMAYVALSLPSSVRVWPPNIGDCAPPESVSRS